MLDQKSVSTRICLVYDLGLIEYTEALRFQRRLAEDRVSGRSGDAFLLLQHYPVYTLGKSADMHNILASTEILRREGIAVYQTDRGGDVTYHGPGQLVGYPIINIREMGLNVHEYVWNLEEMVIRALSEFGICGQRLFESSSYRGVWTGNEKLCAIGIRISRGVTMHGFALNVNTNLGHFDHIIPCGITGKSVTSISKLLGRAIPVDDVKETILKHFAEVFGMKPEIGGRPSDV
ncbi:MAG: lipoyl(octanoyl) transferase LipB [Chloroflexi bacterium]|nr:lipoyl(octanoyl) transferase LipB [Chloroflexota bacterium]